MYAPDKIEDVPVAEDRLLLDILAGDTVCLLQRVARRPLLEQDQGRTQVVENVDVLMAGLLPVEFKDTVDQGTQDLLTEDAIVPRFVLGEVLEKAEGLVSLLVVGQFVNVAAFDHFHLSFRLVRLYLPRQTLGQEGACRNRSRRWHHKTSDRGRRSRRWQVSSS